MSTEIKALDVKPITTDDNETDYKLIIKTYVQHKVKLNDIKRLINIIIRHILNTLNINYTLNVVKIDTRLKSLLRVINKALFEKDIINVKDIIGSRCLLKFDNHLKFFEFYKSLNTRINLINEELNVICPLTSMIKEFKSDYFITQWSFKTIRFEIQFAVRKIEHFRYEIGRLEEVKTEDQLAMQKFIMEEMLEEKEEIIRQLFVKILESNDIDTFNKMLQEIKGTILNQGSNFINFDYIDLNENQVVLRNKIISSLDSNI